MTAKLGQDVIDVVGPTFHNKGDKLMLAALQAKFEPQFRVCCLDGCDSYRTRQVLIGTTRKVPFFGSRLRNLYYYIAPLLSAGTRTWLNVASYSEIAATIDCSGYMYGDPWQKVVRKSQWRLHHYERVKQLGRPVIFMPQAFGPFSHPKLAKQVLSILELADLIACRDRQSLGYVHELGLKGPSVRYVPDITVGAPSIPPADPAAWVKTVVMVPNLRMVDKTDQSKSAQYIDFQVGLIHRIFKRGLKPALVLHETFDKDIALYIAKSSGRTIDIIDVDPLQTKGLIKACRAVLSSRFHALVSSLSQATPCLGTSWTHKYRELFSDYAVPECLLPVDASPQEIDDKLDMILGDTSRAAVTETLRHRAAWHMREVCNFSASLDSLIPSAGQFAQRVVPM